MKTNSSQSKNKAFDQIIKARPTPTVYPPMVEARRAHYEALAEAIALQMHLAGCDPSFETLDIVNDALDDRDSNIEGALYKHWELLVTDFDWMDVRSLRKFYAELRLWRDFLKWEAKQDSIKPNAFVKPAKEDNANACKRIAAAISTIVELHEHLPAQSWNGFLVWLNDLQVNDQQSGNSDSTFRAFVDVLATRKPVNESASTTKRQTAKSASNSSRN